MLDTTSLDRCATASYVAPNSLSTPRKAPVAAPFPAPAGGVIFVGSANDEWWQLQVDNGHFESTMSRSGVRAMESKITCFEDISPENTHVTFKRVHEILCKPLNPLNIAELLAKMAKETGRDLTERRS